MCGIFGFFSAEKKITRDEVRLALKALQHRGPDNAGVACFGLPPLEVGDRTAGRKGEYLSPSSLPDSEWPSVLAHARLSIIDLSDAGNQPMCNASCPECGRKSGTAWITYNGEIYNFPEIRSELVSRGHVFTSRTDSEVLLHGYEEWGMGIVDRLRGMFAFALLDIRGNRLILARDRLGVKPLKYYHEGKTFMFASELGGFTHIIRRRLDIAALNRFFTLKYIPSPYTVFQDVRKLPPATYLVLDMNTWKAETTQYWKPEFVPKSALSFHDAKERFSGLLSESVVMRTISDVPIGVYLSGGMDSSAMVAFLKKNGVKDINTFTIRFERPGYDESEFARMVADRFQTTHHEFQIPDLSYSGIQNIVHSLDEPFGDPSYIPTYYLSKFTSPHVKVVLSGDGGDELLGGYKRYYIHARGKALQYLPPLSMNLFKALPAEVDKKKLLGRLQKIEEDLSSGFWGSYLLRFNGLSGSFKRRVMIPEFYRKLGRLSIDDIIQRSGHFTEITDTIEKFIWIDLHTYLPDYILTKTDLALMAHSVEGRNPFVDYRLVEFSNSLPPEYKFRNGGKHILRTILEDHLPHEVIHRKKMGFSPPIKYWFKGNPALLYAIFSKDDFVSGDMFSLKSIHAMIEDFTTTEVNVSEQLWLMMVLEIWRRKNRV